MQKFLITPKAVRNYRKDFFLTLLLILDSFFLNTSWSLISFLVSLINILHKIPFSGSHFLSFTLPNRSHTVNIFEAHPIVPFFFVRSFKGLPLHILGKSHDPHQPQGPAGMVAHLSSLLLGTVLPMPTQFGAFPMLSFL